MPGIPEKGPTQYRVRSGAGFAIEIQRERQLVQIEALVDVIVWWGWKAGRNPRGKEWRTVGYGLHDDPG